MKKYIIYTGILLAGLLLGWLLFGDGSKTETSHNHDAITEDSQMWTCSMHPQIMQPEAGACPICGMDLIPAETSASGLLANQFKLTENAMALANIQTSVVGTSDLVNDNGLTLSGKVMINADETAIQPAHFNGRIEKLYVTSLGEKVNKGQAVAKIYSPELIAAQQELITAYKLKASQPQLYQAVLTKFKNWKVHGPQLDEVLKTGQVKTSFTIYSHVSGVVTDIAVSDGAHIMDGKPIFKVSNLNTVWANFDVYENQISSFKKGQDIKVVTKAYPDQVFNAKVSYIDPILNTQTRTVTLRVVLKNKDNMFKPGMFVEGKIAASQPEKTQIIVPASAVLWTGKRSVVYIKSNPSEPVFEMKSIELGSRIGDYYQVLNGLNNGDEIVTNGTFTIDAAAQLQGKKSMMNKSGGKTTTGHEGHTGMTASEHQKSVRLKVSSEFQAELKIILDAYISVKDALIDEDFNLSTEKGNLLLQKIENINMALLKTEDARKKGELFINPLKRDGKLLADSKTIKDQRTYFKNVSTNLMSAIEVFGVNQKIYSHFCPMANNNNGAFWLSKEDNVLNPYFGEAMLKCGEVKQIIE
ncbi:efflux RND transporter periplasmic adaptor subunit [Algibacter miyuki]|uniref:Efflux RND transporter periplasmic adaptor subunit n=1 Tax=Algibacter miyuki TaxID=1306933 RepID=A0ABV5H4G1_9FLAO|nr:efflux RND transporter periplasmic adaptor subunit [Algibacter miyuki]MDN3663802.1 efflux RND transporter periplasmic adaptor subunit [Algibacter miyuki]